MRRNFVQVRIEPQLTALIDQAVARTGLNKSELLRQALRKGVLAVVHAAESSPKKTLIDALRGMKGLKIPERTHRMKSQCEIDAQ